jgi:hypothetical protein
MISHFTIISAIFYLLLGLALSSLLSFAFARFTHASQSVLLKTRNSSPTCWASGPAKPNPAFSQVALSPDPSIQTQKHCAWGGTRGDYFCGMPQDPVLNFTTLAPFSRRGRTRESHPTLLRD